ncbi:unnamed protein product [Phaedon cochleariae]|uniref:Carbohydrate kinase PfkB domain-containing protein n=1 Tax=Phaedon cochleariae TaxID=80249 RepID=A0A9N9X4Q2_PHACE|nr:unnamed protein product [Phaedon cochleariae]
MQEAAHISMKLLNFIDNILVTLGSDGLLIARRGSATDNFQENLQLSSEHVRHYPIEEIHDLVNVSGAGDCFSSGFIAAAISGMPEEVCVSVGFAAAKLALQCQAAVPIEMFDKGHECWKTPAKYQTIL